MKQGQDEAKIEKLELEKTKPDEKLTENIEKMIEQIVKKKLEEINSVEEDDFKSCNSSENNSKEESDEKIKKLEERM